jgi:hypothetical protein
MMMWVLPDVQMRRPGVWNSLSSHIVVLAMVWPVAVQFRHDAL